MELDKMAQEFSRGWRKYHDGFQPDHRGIRVTTRLLGIIPISQRYNPVEIRELVGDYRDGGYVYHVGDMVDSVRDEGYIHISPYEAGRLAAIAEDSLADLCSSYEKRETHIDEITHFYAASMLLMERSGYDPRKQSFGQYLNPEDHLLAMRDQSQAREVASFLGLSCDHLLWRHDTPYYDHFMSIVNNGTYADSKVATDARVEQRELVRILPYTT